MSLVGIGIGLASIVFGLLGLICCAAFAFLLKQRERLSGTLELIGGELKSKLLFWIPFVVGTLVAGSSMLVAAVVVWHHHKLGLALGLWPPFVWALIGVGYQIRAAKGQAPNPQDFLGKR